MIKRRSVAKRGVDAPKPRYRGHGLRIGGANRHPAARTRDAREPARRPVAPTHQPFARTPPRRGGRRDDLRIGDEMRLLSSLSRPIEWAPVYRPRGLATSMLTRLKSNLPAPRNSSNGSRCRRCHTPQAASPAIVTSASCRWSLPAPGADPPEGYRCAARTRRRRALPRR